MASAEAVASAHSAGPSEPRIVRRAYVVIAHEQPAHLVRLCRALNAPEARCFVHFDRARGQGPVLPANAEYVAEPMSVNHGGYSLTRAMIHSLRAAMREPFEYVVFLSGRDYPIKPDRDLTMFLADHQGTNFINFYHLGPDTEFVHHASQRFFVDARARLPRSLRPLAVNLERVQRLVLPRHRFPFGHRVFRGSAFFALTREAAEFVISFLDSEPGGRYQRFFRRSWGSDEMMFQTILLNSPFASSCRYFDRDNDRLLRNENDASLHYIDWDPARERPAILEMHDYERLMASKHFFARKFDEHRSQALLHALDENRASAGAASQP